MNLLYYYYYYCFILFLEIVLLCGSIRWPSTLHSCLALQVLCYFAFIYLLA